MHRDGTIILYVIDFISRKYSMLADFVTFTISAMVSNWFWSVASSMLFIQISGIQMLLLPYFCNVLIQYLDEAVC